MDSSQNDKNFASKGLAFVDKTADKVQSGIYDAKQGANSTASSISNKVESLRGGTGELFDQVSEKAQTLLDRLSDATQKAKDFAADTQDSVVTYTREKPVKALLIAAATGAVLITLIRAMTPSDRA